MYLCIRILAVIGILVNLRYAKLLNIYILYKKKRSIRGKFMIINLFV